MKDRTFFTLCGAVVLISTAVAAGHMPASVPHANAAPVVYVQSAACGQALETYNSEQKRVDAIVADELRWNYRNPFLNEHAGKRNMALALVHHFGC